MFTKPYIEAFCLFFIINSYACNKGKNELTNSGTILSQTITTEHFNIPGYKNQVSTRNYNYNQDNKLVSIIGSSESLKDSFLFEYNSQGQLITMKLSNSSAGPIVGYNFLYDTQGRIIRKTGTIFLANLATNDLSYTYDSNNKIVADSQHNGKSAEIANYNVYEYNDSGNISRQSAYKNINGTLQPDAVAVYTYDDKINPYYQNRSAEYFGEDQIFALSRNNLRPESANPSTYIPTFSYFSNGLPKRIVYNQPPGDDYYTIDFIYKNISVAL